MVGQELSRFLYRVRVAIDLISRHRRCDQICWGIDAAENCPRHLNRDKRKRPDWSELVFHVTEITGSFAAREAAEPVDDQNNPASIHLLGMTTRSAQH